MEEVEFHIAMQIEHRHKVADVGFVDAIEPAGHVPGVDLHGQIQLRAKRMY